MGFFSFNNMKNFARKYKIAVMVVLAGFISNMVVKGFMKSIGKLIPHLEGNSGINNDQ